jgi:hypothetical protein
MLFLFSTNSFLPHHPPTTPDILCANLIGFIVMQSVIVVSKNIYFVLCILLGRNACEFNLDVCTTYLFIVMIGISSINTLRGICLTICLLFENAGS